MPLNPLETRLLDALETVRDYLTQKTLYKKDYYHLMSVVRDTIKFAEKKKYSRGNEAGQIE